MKLRSQHLEAIREQGIESRHRAGIAALRQQGFHVAPGSRGAEFVVHDAANGEARVETRGRFTRTTTGEGRVIETEQYTNGRIRSLRDPAGNGVLFERDKEGFLTAIDRGAAGGRFLFDLTPDWQPKRIQYPDGTASLIEFDEEKRPVRVVDRAGHTTQYERNLSGELTSVIDVQGRRTTIEYEGWSLPTAIVQPDGARHEFSYGSDGRLEGFSIGGREHGRYRFDEKTGFHEARYHDGSWVQLKIEDGRITAAINEHGVVELTYDTDGRLLSDTFAGASVRFERDAVGGLLALGTPDGERIGYRRDRDQRLVELADWSGRLTRISWPAAGPPRRIEYPNGTSVEQVCDELGRLTSWTLSGPTGPLAGNEWYRWQYDNCDRLTRESRSSHDRGFEYDDSGRIRAVESGDKALEERFELDASGNRVIDGNRVCEVDACNRLRVRGHETFAYDALGNLTSSSEWTFRYDARGHLLEASRAGVVVHYAYDALGRRIRKQVGDRVTHFRWAGAQLLSEVTVEGGREVERRDFLIAPDLSAPLAMRVGNAVYHFHSGRRHEVLSMTDVSGAVVWRADYRAFGGASVGSARVSQPWRLAGHYFDDETGLHYVGARYLSPSLGRFLTPDPLGPESRTQNLYILCDGDPVNRIDPTGEIGLTLGTVLTAMAIGAVVGAAIGAGIELYKQRNETSFDWAQVGRAALIGGCIGAIGAAVGAVATAAAGAVVGGVAAGAIGGGLASGIEYCVEAIGTREFSVKALALSVGAGAIAGAATAGIGGVVAARAARKAAREAVEEAARKGARELEEEAARKLLRDAEEEAARRLAREAEDRAAREAAARLAQRSAAGAAPDRNGLSKAGRALQKHGSRPGSVFPKASGSPQALNKQGQQVLDEILHSPNQTTRPNRFGGQDIFDSNTGRGARFDGNGEMMGFLEP